MKLIKEQNNAEQMVLEAAQEVFVGNSFYLGIKSSVCNGVRPVSLIEVVNHNSDYDSLTSTQEIDRVSLVANQIIPVVGKTKIDVSSIIRSVLKQDNSCVKSCVSEKKTFLSYGSLVSENLTQEEASGFSTFSQPTIVLSCDFTHHQSCEDSKIIKEHASIRSLKPDQDESIGQASSKKSGEGGGLNFVQWSNKTNDLWLPPDVSNDPDNKQNYLNDPQARPPETRHVESNLCGDKENMFPIAQEDNNKGEDMDSVIDTTSCDLFDSTEFGYQSSINIPSFSEYRKLDTFTSNNPKHTFSAQLNIQEENKHFPDSEVKNCSILFSQEMFTPSPILNIRSATSSKHDKGKILSSSKYLGLLRKKLKSLPNIPPDQSHDGCKYDPVFTYSPGERESPLLFSDMSCDHSVTPASPLHNDVSNSNECTCISPDIFESTPKQITLKKSTLSPYLVKKLFKD